MKWTFLAFLPALSLGCLGSDGCATQPGAAANESSTVEALRDSGFHYYEAGRYRDALACYSALFHMAESDVAHTSLTASDLNNLGILSQQVGNYRDAQMFYQREIALLNLHGRGDSVMAREVYSKYGSLLEIQGAYADAEASYKKAINVLEKSAGPQAFLSAVAVSQLARLYLIEGRMPEASTMVRRARTIAEKNLAEDDPQLITFYDLEASFLAETGKYSAAEKEWLSAAKIAEPRSGEHATEYSALLLHLGQMYFLIGDYLSAQATFERSLAAQEKTVGSDPIDRGIIMSLLGEAYMRERNYAEAKPFILKAAEVSATSCNAVPLACALIRSDVGDFYMANRLWQKAESEFELALKLRLKTLGNHRLAAQSMFSLSEALRKLNRKKEAKTYAAEASRILEDVRDPLYDGSETADVRAFRANNR